MEALVHLLNSGPGTLVVVAVILVVLQKAGALETLLSFVSSKNKDSGDVNFGALLGQMETLSEHFNHETTGLLTEIRDEIKKLNQRHENYEIVGIKTRECAKRP